METNNTDVSVSDNIDHLWNDIEYQQFSALPNSEPVSCIYSADSDFQTWPLLDTYISTESTNAVYPEPLHPTTVQYDYPVNDNITEISQLERIYNGGAPDTAPVDTKTHSNTKFVCPEMGCGKFYSHKSGLDVHLKKKHAKVTSYPCDECNGMFLSTQQRTMHKIEEHEGRRYKTANLKKRKATDDDKVPLAHSYKCLYCSDVFYLKLDLTKHTKNSHSKDGELYPCPECSKVFYTLDMFMEHRDFHDDSIPKYECIDCGKQLLTRKKLKEHSTIHQERVKFQCEVCQKVFLRSQTLQYHRITCKAAFSCDLCVDSFMTAEALAKHQSLHKSDDFTCSKCNKAFLDQDALDNHMKRHSLRMNYTCQICKASVATRAKFQKHIKDHLESDLKCPVCNEKFKSLVRYGYHKVEMHSITRPYDCVLCKDVFCTRQELFIHLHNHIDSHTSTSTLVCELCGMKFSMKTTYDQHKRSHEKHSNIELDSVELLQNEELHNSSNTSTNDLPGMQVEPVTTDEIETVYVKTESESNFILEI